MKSFIRLTDYRKEELTKIFELADAIKKGEYQNSLDKKTIVLFFPSSSIRTRVTFEKGIHGLGGQAILFPNDVLDKKESIKDVMGYLNNWVDCIIVRHSNIELISEMKLYSEVPIINAMTNVNHPCEVLSDLYALSQLRENIFKLNYVFVGPSGNIGKAWVEASKVFGFNLIQSCPHGYEIEDVNVEYNINYAMKNGDIILTDSLSKEMLEDFKSYQVTKELMLQANEKALLNPCPPFFRGEEVSENVIDSDFFVGYDFKKALLPIQQAIILQCIL